MPGARNFGQGDDFRPKRAWRLILHILLLFDTTGNADAPLRS